MSRFHYLVAAAFYMIATAIAIPGSNAVPGKFNDAVDRIYLEDPAKRQEHFLTEINWLRGGPRLVFASAKWKNKPSFIKCGLGLEVEANIFNIIMNGETQSDAQIHPGRNHIQHPLHMFSMGQKLCFVYNFVPGIELEDYFNAKSTMTKILLLVQILPGILKGTSYLHQLGVVHSDLHEENVLVYENPQTHQFTATIIDYNLASLLNPQECAQIGRKAFPSSDRLHYASARVDNKLIARMIGKVIEKRIDVPAITSDGLVHAKEILEHLLKEKQLTPNQQAIAIKIIRLLLYIRHTLNAETSTSQTTVAVQRTLKQQLPSMPAIILQ